MMDALAYIEARLKELTEDRERALAGLHALTGAIHELERAREALAAQASLPVPHED
jgi:prefoldin subunit 5